MITPVSFELAKLLKEKGFDELCEEAYQKTRNQEIKLVKDGKNFDKFNWNDIKIVECSAPTIAEVVMWLYEKYDLWISVNDYGEHEFGYDPSPIYGRFDSPTEAYEAAIEYTLKNFI